MTRCVTVLMLMLLLFSVKFAAADFYSDCSDNCDKTQTQCIEGITLYDPTGIQEAKDACNNEQVACIKRCHEEDEQMQQMGKDGYQQMLKKQAEEAEKTRQEQQSGDGVKSYNFDK